MSPIPCSGSRKLRLFGMTRIQELQRAHANISLASFLYSIIGCVGTFLVAVVLASATSWPVFHKYVRMGLSEYAAAISIILFIGIPHIGELNTLDQQRLPISSMFPPFSGLQASRPASQMS